MVGIKNIQRHTPSDEYFTPEYVWDYLFRKITSGEGFADLRRSVGVLFWEPFDVQRKGYFGKLAEEKGVDHSTLGWDNREEIFKVAGDRKILLVTNPPYSGSYKTDVIEFCKEHEVEFWLLLPSIIPFHNYGMNLIIDHHMRVEIYALPQVDYEYKGPAMYKADGSEKNFKKSPFRSIWLHARPCDRAASEYDATMSVWVDCVKTEKAKDEILNPRHKRRKLRHTEKESKSSDPSFQCSTPSSTTTPTPASPPTSASGESH